MAKKRKYETKQGGEFIALYPCDKAGKYAEELKNGVRLTNAGKSKLGEDDKPIKLGKKTTKDLQARAYRAGYLDAQKDSAAMFKADPKNSEYIPKKKSWRDGDVINAQAKKK